MNIHKSTSTALMFASIITGTSYVVGAEIVGAEIVGAQTPSQPEVSSLPDPVFTSQPAVQVKPTMHTSPLVNIVPAIKSTPDIRASPAKKPAPRAPHVNGNPREHSSQQKQLGNNLYFDTNLSEPDGQACATCHVKSAGRADPDRNFPISEGVVPGIWGTRNAPSTGYTMFNPRFQFVSDRGGRWIGGQLLDGRATGEILGDPLADQALGPFLNPLEMNNPGKETVIRDVASSHYARLFQSVCGTVDLNNSHEVDVAFDCIATSIAAFERTREFAKFNSQYDRYLKKCIGLGDQSEQALNDCARGRGTIAKQASVRILSASQWKGMELFMGFNNNDGVLQPGEGAACAACHTVNWSSESDYELKVQVPEWAPQGMVPPLFTDFSYHNVGIPKNNHFLLSGNSTDLGLGGRSDLLDPQEHGKFKVSSLRNIAKSGPYGHNGLFNSLNAYTNFYNTRDVGSWPIAEVTANQNQFLLGNLGLSTEQEQQIVDFMKALTDGAF